MKTQGSAVGTSGVAVVIIAVMTAASAWAGGTTGGGGSVLLGDRVAPTRLIRAVERSKTPIRAWLSNKAEIYRSLKKSGQCAAPSTSSTTEICTDGPHLFDQTPNVFDVLESLEIEVQKSAACTDFGGAPNDGSSSGSKTGSICISVFNLHTKLREDNYENQTAALILHEIAHVMGMTEERAEFLQKSILDSFVAFRPVRGVFLETAKAWSKLIRAHDRLDLWSKTQYLLGYENSCTESWAILEEMYDAAFDYVYSYGFRFMSPNLSIKFWGAYVKMNAIWHYSCAHDSREDAAKRKAFQDLYEKSFNGRAEIGADDYDSIASDQASSQVRLGKITDFNSYLGEINSVTKLFHEVTNEFQVETSGFFAVY